MSFGESGVNFINRVGIAESTMNQVREFKSITIPPDIEPQRLDKYLSLQPELDLSRSHIQKLIADGLVLVNGKEVSKSHELHGGEIIKLTTLPPAPINLTPENIPLDIVYEDEFLAIVNKPAGLVVHPAPGNPEHTLANALMYHLEHLSSATVDHRPGIIHRLDKGTSGLLVVAKSDPVARRLRDLFAERQVVKIYHGISCGHMPEDDGTIDLPLGRSIKDRKKMAVTHLHSREAITHYHVVERFRVNDLVEIRLETGRTHQIRVHFSHIHRPILGDPDYGGRIKWVKGIDPSQRRLANLLLELIPRQALHASRLEFDHPETGEKISVSGEMPDDLKKLLQFLRESGS